MRRSFAVLILTIMLATSVETVFGQIQGSGQPLPKQGDNPTRDRTRYPTRLLLVEPPSSRYRTFREALFNVAVPENWREVEVSERIIGYAPNNGFGTASNGQIVFTHGVKLGVAQVNSTDLQTATREFIRGLQAERPNLRTSGDYQRTTVDGRAALAMQVNNVNEATRHTVITTTLSNGQLFYLIFVSPGSEYDRYQRAFNDILRSLRLNLR